MNRKLIPGELYKHFKGDVVEIICVARNSETLEDEVSYYHIEDNE